MSIRLTRRRSGFTLIELLIAMTVVLLLLGVGTQFFRKQANALSAQSGRLEAQQTSQFGLATLDRELRVAGVGVVDIQPILVQADPLAVTFNADLISRTPGDPGAVYIDIDADSDAVHVFRRSDAVVLPRSTKAYPDSTYMKAAGVPSGAETISFWLSKDSTAKAANEYILFRRANAQPPRLVAKGVIVNSTDTVFQYFKADTVGALAPISTSSLPLLHKAPVHGSVADTGKLALIDSVRAMRIRLNVVHHDPRTGDTMRRLETTIRLINTGLNRRTTCGEPPLAVVPTVTAANVAGQPAATLKWSRSGDEGAGEKDVERYAIYKRLNSSIDFAEPFASVPAGSASYTFVDTDVRTGEMWVYGVAAADCTPSSSSIGNTSVITIP